MSTVNGNGALEASRRRVEAGQRSLKPLATRAHEGADKVIVWCETCRENCVPMRDGSCGFCGNKVAEPVNSASSLPAAEVPVPETTVRGQPAEPGLRMGEELTFPLSAATESLAILAVKGAGKSNAAAVLAEELFDEGIPWVVIDPKGDWWGLRESVGDARGLPVLVLGGMHGELELSPYAGRQIAELLVERDLTCVLDISHMDDEERPIFLQALGERLFELHRENPHHCRGGQRGRARDLPEGHAPDGQGVDPDRLPGPPARPGNHARLPCASEAWSASREPPARQSGCQRANQPTSQNQ